MTRRRRVNIRPQKQKIYIFCEGSVTEVRYLTELERAQNTVKFEFVQKGAVPATLYQSAKQKTSTISGEVPDRVWLLFDRDDHPQVDQILTECERSDIVLGFSNPCFELWLYWHFEDYGGMDDRTKLKATLTDNCTDYCGRTKSLRRADRLMASVNDAAQRAFASMTRLENSDAKYGRPTSTMYEIIDDFAKCAKLEGTFWTKPT